MPLLINLDIPAAAVSPLLHALNLALVRGQCTAGERAQLQAVADDITLAALAAPVAAINPV